MQAIALHQSFSPKEPFLGVGLRQQQQQLTASTRIHMDPARIRDALAGTPDAVDELMRAATPVIQARVARALLRRPESRGRDIRQEIADFTQDVFVALFSADGKALRAWDPERGLSFANFVGLLAQRRVSSMLRTRQGSPWNEELHADSAHEDSLGQSPPDADAGSRELLRRVLEELEATLSPRGMELFQRLYVAQEAVEDVCKQTGLRPNAVHQWRRRLGVAAREVLERLQREQRASEPEPRPIRSARVAIGSDAVPDRARRVR